MAAITECRLCRSTVESRSIVHLFTAKGLEKKWSTRISTILGIRVDKMGRLSPHVCCMCTRRLESLENAAADLQDFKQLAQRSLEVAHATRGPVKRTRVTSGEVGVSPDTARARPSSKLSRRQLLFSDPPPPVSSLVPGTPSPAIQGVVHPPVLSPSQEMGSAFQGTASPILQGEDQPPLPSPVQGVAAPPLMQVTVQPPLPSPVQGVDFSPVQDTAPRIATRRVARAPSQSLQCAPPVQRKRVTVSLNKNEHSYHS